MSKITFTVKATALKGYWIAVGKKDVPLRNRTGSVVLKDDQRHILVWWMEGNAGGSLAISGTLPDGTEVVAVKEADNKIPQGSISWADTKVFELKGKAT